MTLPALDVISSFVAWVLDSQCHNYYATNLRSSFFTGFLTLGSLLLALKTFTLNTIKKDIYDSDAYKEIFLNLKRLKPSLKYYDPLKQLSRTLFIAMVCAFSTSSFQVTFGLIPYNFIALIGIAAAIGTLGVVFWGLYLIYQNLKIWQDTFKEPELPPPGKSLIGSPPDSQL